MDKLKLVKTIVFVITFLLVFGCMLLLGTLYKKLHHPTAPQENNINLNEPAGSSISQMQQHNGSLYLLVKGGGQSDRVIIYNPENPLPIRLNIN